MPARGGCRRLGMDGTRQGERAPIVPRELVLVSGLILVVVCWLFIVAFAGRTALSSVRAYIAGEGFSSKAQKDAVEHWLRYAETRNELEYERYQAAIAVPIAEARARQELERGDGRTEVALRALEAGGNHPDDVEAMALLFRHASWLREMADAIVIWSSADAEVAHIDATARTLHTQLQRERPELRVLYMSGFTEDPGIQREIEGAGLAFLQKPFTPGVLAQKVRAVLDAEMRSAA
ncbi:MAG TPA: hypothetical protein VKM54_02725 [Myxococcota bacterium]|nr:hypothetical protein [Myxococcota bacterium]